MCGSTGNTLENITADKSTETSLSLTDVTSDQCPQNNICFRTAENKRGSCFRDDSTMKARLQLLFNFILNTGKSSDLYHNIIRTLAIGYGNFMTWGLALHALISICGLLMVIL